MGKLRLCECRNKLRITHVYEANGKYLEPWSLIVCDKCGVATPKSYRTDEEAIAAWNGELKMDRIMVIGRLEK